MISDGDHVQHLVVVANITFSIFLDKEDKYKSQVHKGQVTNTVDEL